MSNRGPIRGEAHTVMPAHRRDVAVDAADIWPDYRPTRLIDVPVLARAAGVGRVLVKLECERPLGNFKALGGMVAGLRALARVAGVERLRDLRAVAASTDRDARSAAAGGRDSQAGDAERRIGPRVLPQLVCASAGNHGLAVAAAARWAGTRATVYLAEGANRARAARIEALGARVVWTPGAYDDAVEEAAKADGLVIADTSRDPYDPVVRDVMDGYQLISREVIAQLPEAGPTHLFVQGGVGGLAAALTEGLQASMRPPQRAIVVEPQSTACVAAALAAGHPVHIAGKFDTSAEMLACGLASAPAVKILREHGAQAVQVTEAQLEQAVELLRETAGRSHDSGGDGNAHSASLNTTASGATGLAGLLHASSSNELRERHHLTEESCVLLVITEVPVPSTSTIFGTS